jgi:hypothetical protein
MAHMNFMQLFRRRALWNVALYRLTSISGIFEVGDKVPEHFFGASGFRLSRNYQSTVADPFLFAHSGRLYIFFEVKTDFGRGEIWAESMGSNGIWERHGCVLAEDFHVSYPNVFSDSEGNIYMIPETATSGKAWLYTTEEFPFKWRRSRVLLDAPLKDPSIIFTQNHVLLLGTTRQDELMVHKADSIDDKFNPQGVLISKDRATSRSGGGLFVAAGKLYRPAQNCTISYGLNISIMEVDIRGSNEYSESLFISDLCRNRPDWMELGYHHMSVAKFGEDYFLAIDGRRRDKYVNTLLLAYFTLFEKSRVR